ncbi:hypothetical protein [Komagataeibacter sp. FNDCR2]|uniref:hypothetical protein n=1 Tax=Komagataeibacter sp. FNDCR2 TaxID=2878682 RepID=UPI001E291A66|nr:hypothetical protein [Komagataeibacter sp. FNDCR2]MCE2576724.1 hypothetical protein [Komagataeibacter sp. FNDCR2]
MGYTEDNGTLRRFPVERRKKPTLAHMQAIMPEADVMYKRLRDWDIPALPDADAVREEGRRRGRRILLRHGLPETREEAEIILPRLFQPAIGRAIDRLATARETIWHAENLEEETGEAGLLGDPAIRARVDAALEQAFIAERDAWRLAQRTLGAWAAVEDILAELSGPPHRPTSSSSVLAFRPA